MSSSSVSISAAVPLDAPRGLAAPVLEKLLRGLELDPERAALSVDLARDLQFPVEATVKVPVQLQLVAIRPPATFEIRLHAAEQREYYPEFTGLLTLESVDAPLSSLRISGTYAVPLGAFGAALDMTLLAGAAESSLRRFLRRLARETSETVRAGQAEYARATLHFHV